MNVLYYLSRKMALFGDLLCRIRLKAGNICRKSSQILKDAGRSGEKIFGLGAKLLYLTAHGEVSAESDPLQ